MGELRYLIEQLLLSRAAAERVEGGELLVYLVEMALVEAQEQYMRLEKRQ